MEAAEAARERLFALCFKKPHFNFVPPRHGFHFAWRATERFAVVKLRDGGIAYGSHTAVGAMPGDRSATDARATLRWRLRWTAPAEGGAVAFDVAAQVANGDASEFGERLYTARRITRPTPPRCCGSPEAARAAPAAPSSPAG